jgi:hypothetical protein
MSTAKGHSKKFLIDLKEIFLTPRRRRGAETERILVNVNSLSNCQLANCPTDNPAPLRLSGLIVLVLITLISMFSNPATAQTADDILSKFFAVQQDDEVLLRWTIRAGNTCEDTFIERSLDGIQYERIGIIAGVCGSPDQSVTYDFYDTMPAPNRINHYRLILGLYGYTEPQTIEFIVLNEQGYSIQPNPMGGSATLIFRNPAEEEFMFQLYDMNGRKVMEFKTYEDRIILRREILGSGMFIFSLQGKESMLKGKIVVVE